MLSFRRLASRGRTIRRFAGALGFASLGLAAALNAQAPPQKPAQDPKAAQEQQGGQAKPAAGAAQQPPPTFRTEANFVRVDVYPTAGDRPVQDLQRADFEVFEDGQRQEIRTFEHVLIRGGGPQETRVEPSTVRESQEMVADPRARLFVLFIDTYHITREAAYNVRRSLSRLLARTISPTDFVAVMTPEMSAGSITFTRRTASIDELLDQWLKWGRRFEEVTDPDPVEQRYQFCYPPSLGEPLMSAIAREMIARRRESLTIEAMRDLVVHLQGLREERKAILTISEGWALYRPNSNLARITNNRVPGPREVGVGPDGGLRVGDTGRNMGGSSYAECDQDRLRLAQEDHDRDFRDLFDEANRANASFYTVDPRGLPVFDTPLSQGSMPVTLDQAILGGRQDSLRTLAGATDGMAVMNSNDIDKGLKRVVDDLSSYYLLGYYSTNARADGRFHAISVKVKRPGVSVRARRGYRSPTKEELEAVSRGASASRAEPSAPAKAVTALTKMRTDAPVHALAGYEWTPGEGGAAKPSLWVALELDPTAGSRDEQWRGGAEVSLSVTAPDKSIVGQATQVLKRDSRSALLRVPVSTSLPADLAIRVTSKPTGAPLGSTETIRVSVPKPPGDALLVGQPLMYRRGPFSGPAWQAAGDLRYRRQERARMDVPIVGDFGGVEAQLLDRNGTPLTNIPVTAATRDENGQKIASAEVTLAPLTTGDYVLELTVKQGQNTQKVVGAFRIIPN